MNDVVEILKSIGAIVTNDHFVYTSGRHGSVYIRKDMLYPHTVQTSEVCRLFAEKFKDRDIDVVVGPQIGGIILSQWTAHHLSDLKQNEIVGIFTEKDENNNQLFKRDYYKLVKGKNVLIFSGIGNPQGFENAIAGLGIDIAKSFRFADHHAYTQADIDNIIQEARQLNLDNIITTHKDAIKTRELQIKDAGIVALNIKLSITKNEAEFNRRLLKLYSF